MCHTALGGLWTHSRKTNVIPPQPLSYSARPSSPKLLVEHGKAHRPRAILPGTDHGVVCAVRQSLRRSGFLRVNGPRHSPAKFAIPWPRRQERFPTAEFRSSIPAIRRQRTSCAGDPSLPSPPGQALYVKALPRAAPPRLLLARPAPPCSATDHPADLPPSLVRPPHYRYYSCGGTRAGWRGA